MQLTLPKPSAAHQAQHCSWHAREEAQHLISQARLSSLVPTLNLDSRLELNRDRLPSSLLVSPSILSHPVVVRPASGVEASARTDPAVGMADLTSAEADLIGDELESVGVVRDSPPAEP